MNSLRQFGAVFGIAIATPVFNSAGSLTGPAVAFSALGAVVAAAVHRRTRPPAAASEAAGTLATEPAPALDPW